MNHFPQTKWLEDIFAISVSKVAAVNLITAASAYILGAFDNPKFEFVADILATLAVASIVMVVALPLLRAFGRHERDIRTGQVEFFLLSAGGLLIAFGAIIKAVFGAVT